jgi:hypothetical protein
MVAWNLGRPWADQVRAHARTATRPIAGTLKAERPKAFLISTATRERIWLPKRLVRHDAEKGVFTMPAWLAAKKLLD